MKKTLIINFRRIGDIFSMAHLTNSIASDSTNEISLLIFKENIKAAQLLANVKNIYTIDRHELTTIIKNKLFSDGLALEQLYLQLKKIKNEEWNNIINYSNDSSSANICTYLSSSAKKITGVHFGKSRNIIKGNNWEILFNDILPSLTYSPIHFVDCYHKMSAVNYIQSGIKINTQEPFISTSKEKFKVIKGLVSNENIEIKTIGIQLKSSAPNKEIERSTLVKILNSLASENEFVPFLLVAPNQSEREYAALINSEVENEVVIVEASLQAMASVLPQFDLLLSPDTSIKHLADLVGTPVLEVSNGQSPFFKQGTYGLNNLILTKNVSLRNFKKNDTDNDQPGNPTSDDILNTIRYFFSTHKNIKPTLSQNITLYSSLFDQLGVNYLAIAGDINSNLEISRLMNRQVVSLIFNQKDSLEFCVTPIIVCEKTTEKWISVEKISITNATKDLLGTLRSLLQTQENRRSTREFINNLEKLLSRSDEAGIIQVPLLLFKAKIELINAKSFEENSKEVESLLYELKSHIQKCLLCIAKLEESLIRHRKLNFTKRIPENFAT